MPVSEASLANLKPFKPGQVTNPAGRQVPLITPAMRYYAALGYEGTKALRESTTFGQLPNKDCIAIVMLLKAIEDARNGDLTRQEVIRRLDGKEADVGVQVEVGVLVRYVDGKATFDASDTRIVDVAMDTPIVPPEPPEAPTSVVEPSEEEPMDAPKCKHCGSRHWTEQGHVYTADPAPRWERLAQESSLPNYREVDSVTKTPVIKGTSEVKRDKKVDKVDKLSTKATASVPVKASVPEKAEPIKGRGRPKLYASAAEKKAAYRARKATLG